MDENTEKTEYLTVKDVAALVRRNEETIRRMIRARKLDVELSNNNRRQGYMISVDQLVNTWDISREDVERYISARRAEEKPDAPERIPLGPERDIGGEIDRSANIIAREINKIAALAGGANAGEGSRMSRDYNKWTDTDGDEHEPEQNGGTHEYFSADFSDVGERVSEIIGDAYRQIHRAVNQAGAAVDAAIKQSAENAERAKEEQRRHASAARDAAEYARRKQQEHSDAAEAAAERARQALERSFSAIRDSIDRTRDTSGGARATGGWAENIHHPGEWQRPTKPKRPAHVHLNIDDDDEMDDAAIRDEFEEYVEAEAEPANDAAAEQPVEQSDEQPVEQPAEQPAPKQPCAWSNAQPTPAPEVAPERRAKLDFDVPDVGKDAMNEDGNASYQLLQAARRAVGARMNAREAAGQADVPKPADLIEPAFGDSKPADLIEPAFGESKPADLIEPSIDVPEQHIDVKGEADAHSVEVHVEASAPVDMPEQPAKAEAESELPKQHETIKVPDVSADAAEAPVDDTVPQLPTEDEDALKQRISSLEDQLKMMSSQLELLTRHLMGKDSDK